MNHKIKKLIILLCILNAIILLTACTTTKSERAYSEYQAAFEEFCTANDNYKTALNAIDENSPTGGQEMIAQMDIMNEAFQTFAAIEAPKKFSEAETYANDAATYFSEATELFRASIDDESQDPFNLSMANEKYTKAFNRMKAVSAIIRGKTPDPLWIL